nr:retrovirus-related Pol polyprotein from transposon TNT 1-94 [Ipomoea batatas]
MVLVFCCVTTDLIPSDKLPVIAIDRERSLSPLLLVAALPIHRRLYAGPSTAHSCSCPSSPRSCHRPTRRKEGEQPLLLCCLPTGLLHGHAVTATVLRLCRNLLGRTRETDRGGPLAITATGEVADASLPNGEEKRGGRGDDAAASPGKHRLPPSAESPRRCRRIRGGHVAAAAIVGAGCRSLLRRSSSTAVEKEKEEKRVTVWRERLVTPVVYVVPGRWVAREGEGERNQEIRRGAENGMELFCSYISSIISTHEPQSYKEAVQSEAWKQATQSEIDALVQNNTWTLTDLPAGKSPIRCGWVYKIKLKADGSVERYKARLVAKGYTQQLGVDYIETFSPVARMTTIKTFFAVAVAKG